MRAILFLLLSTIICFGFRPKEKWILPTSVAKEMAQLPQALDFNIDIKPILSDKCFACHGPDKAKQKAGLRLDIAENAFARLPENPKNFAIVPGNPAKSELVLRILSDDPTYKMPSLKSHLNLSAKEKALLVKWVQDGAIYKPHWAFVSPVKKVIPSESIGLNPIDYWVGQRLIKEKLKQNGRASRQMLLRRLSLDLTGLPPSLDEIENFKKDTRPNATEILVDRLLASPHFGEKMAAEWLDIARFADSHGYTVDRIRDMSPYRDWVIDAFNQNLPYDKFIHYQLAGDLLQNPTKEMRIATAFNRNHQQNTEGGIVEEEYQTEYVIDRANTFGEAFMAMGVGCARCHDHKYDPISQKNYYQLYSFFNNVREAGQISFNDDLPTPTMLLPTSKQEEVLKFIQTKIKTTEEKIVSRVSEGFEAWNQKDESKKLTQSIFPKNGLLGHFNFDSNLINLENEKEVGVIKRESGKTGDLPVFGSGFQERGLTFDGDVYVDFGKIGVFRKSEPFTIGMWVNVPKELKEGVIFHKSNAERLYNFKGFHVYLKNGQLEIMMAHTAPSNAITKLTTSDIPRDRWVHLTLTYDGSSKAAGLLLYLNGDEMATETVIDQLYKDIIFYSKQEPGLQIGGWWRGLGFKGGQVDEVFVYNRTLRPYEVQILANRQKSDLIFADVKNRKDYYDHVLDSNRLALQADVVKWRTALSDSSEKIRELMVMQEMPKPKHSFLLKRGQYDAKGEEVFPSTPEKIFPFQAKFPKNRLGLAYWLTDSNNPLTARVAINRFWQNLFGLGLVKTSEDFGNQGEMPTHPELLDDLAVTFRESGWDIKKMIKSMVLSDTYQQESGVSKDLMEKDPENRFLARGPSTRLTAEMMRDNILVASDLINRKIGGRSIYPYQPEGLWDINGSKYKQDVSDEVYRRSLYIVIKRSVPNPTMSSFDASSRSSCLARRQKTNTPLQALVILNDPTFVEASKVIGLSMSKLNDRTSSIKQAYLRLTGREPYVKELEILENLQKASFIRFEKSPEKARGLLESGLYKLDKNENVALIASYAVVASTIMNSDATIMKR